MPYQIQLGTFTIQGTSSWQESMISRVPVETIPRRQGALVPTAPLKGPKTGRFDFVVDGDTEAELLQYLDDLKIELEKGEGQLYLRDDNRYLKAVKTNFVIIHQASQLPALRASGYIEFIIADPYWYSEMGEQSNLQATISSSPYTYYMTNFGGAPTPPRIAIKALSANKTGTFKLTNQSSGLYVQWGSGTIAGNKTLIIDCSADPFSVTNDGVNALGSFSGSRDFLLLAQDPQYLKYEGPTGVDVTLTWTERWN